MTPILGKIRLAVGGGVLGWIITKMMLFTDYVDSVGGMDNVVWATVIGAALPIILDGLIAIGALKTPTVAQTTTEAEKPVERVTAPDLGPIDRPLFDEPFDTPNYFSQAELECKGQTCNCTYPGMDGQVMAMVNDLREHFGPLIVNSAYRCPEHNAAVGGAKESYHVLGRALDVRSPTHPPKALYEYLDEKYPRQYGFGLYQRFIHLDNRIGSYARKANAESEWKKYANNPDIGLA